MAGRSQGVKNLMHKYWNELAHNKHQFFKTMFADFHHQMMIPEKFCECFKGNLGEWCTLKGPSGDKWRVRVTRSRQDCNAIIFSEGWPDFVKDNGIKKADLLVFSYSGVSSYDVSIFDLTGCEREGAFFTTTKYSNSNSNNVGKVDQFADESESESESEESGSEWLEDHQHNYSSSSSDDSPRGSRAARGRGVYKRKRAFQKSQRLDEDTDEDTDQDYSSCRASRRGRRSSTSRAGAKQLQTVYESTRRPVSRKEIRRAYDTATKFEMANQLSGNMVVIEMLPTHVYHGFHLTIPKDWAMKNMIRKNHDVKLRVPGVGKWIVSCRWTPLQCQLRPRWPLFVWENNLEEHDVCVFELVRRGDLRNGVTPVLDVHIFRVVDKCTPLVKIRN